MIASWPKPNYVDPVTQGPALSCVCIIFSSLSLAIVTARTYSRIFITKAPGIDDLLVAIAAAFGIALSVMVVIQEKTWLTGHHIWDIPVDRFAGQRESVYICEWFYLTATCSVKISILLFYRRLSVTFSKTFLIATWVGIIYNVLYWVTFVICLLVLFRPLDSYWLSFDPTWAATHEYSRGDEAWSLPTSGALSVIGDFYSTVLPLMLIRFLDLPQRQKAALYTLFGIGFLVVGAGIVRTILLNRVISKTYDVSWVLWENWIWTVLELNVAILAASAPALKPFFRRFLINPIASSGKQAAYAFDSRRRSSLGKIRSVKRFTWSNNTSTMRDSNMPINVDVEKIGIALTASQSKAEMIEEEIDDDASMRRYHLRTSREGKLIPVQIHEQRSFDARSSHTAKSSDYILPPSRTGEIDPPELKLYQYREGQSPVSAQQYQFLDLCQSRDGPHAQNGGVQGIRRPLDTILSQPSIRSRSRSGSVKAARIRLQQLQELEQDHTLAHTRSISRGSERNFSLPNTAVVPVGSRNIPYQHQQQLSEGAPEEEEEKEDAYSQDRDRNSSEETLELPRQGSRNGNWRSADGVGYAV